jgi:hypothetical protein
MVTGGPCVAERRRVPEVASLPFRTSSPELGSPAMADRPAGTRGPGRPERYLSGPCAPRTDARTGLRPPAARGVRGADGRDHGHAARPARTTSAALAGRGPDGPPAQCRDPGGQPGARPAIGPRRAGVGLGGGGEHRAHPQVVHVQASASRALRGGLPGQADDRRLPQHGPARAHMACPTGPGATPPARGQGPRSHRSFTRGARREGASRS